MKDNLWSRLLFTLGGFKYKKVDKLEIKFIFITSGKFEYVEVEPFTLPCKTNLVLRDFWDKYSLQDKLTKEHQAIIQQRCAAKLMLMRDKDMMKTEEGALMKGDHFIECTAEIKIKSWNVDSDIHYLTFEEWLEYQNGN